MAEMKKILIVDDEINTRMALVRYLRRRFEIDEAENGEVAIHALKQKDYDLVLTDLRMPGVDGIGVLDAALSKANAPQCIVFTAYGSVEKAVEAVKKGAFDFMTKPVKLDKLEAVINKALDSIENPPAAPLRKNSVQSANLCRSEAMQKLYEVIETVAPSRSTVLITGESGSGKEVAAKMLHKLSNRKGLFVASVVRKVHVLDRAELQFSPQMGGNIVDPEGDDIGLGRLVVIPEAHRIGIAFKIPLGGKTAAGEIVDGGTRASCDILPPGIVVKIVIAAAAVLPCRLKLSRGEAVPNAGDPSENGTKAPVCDDPVKRLFVFSHADVFFDVHRLISFRLHCIQSITK